MKEYELKEGEYLPLPLIVCHPRPVIEKQSLFAYIKNLFSKKSS